MPVKYRQNEVSKSSSYSAWLLYIYSLPYLLAVISKLLSGELLNLVLVSAVLFSIILSAHWMGIGLKNKSHFTSRKFKNNAPFPMMFLSSLLLGIANFVGAWLLAEYNLFSAIGFGIAATVGCWLWYGLDAVKSKHIGFSDVTDADKALEILQNSETLVISIEKANRGIDNAEMSHRLNKITTLARDVLAVLYSQPNKIRKARRFLNTYLTGAESVVERYANNHNNTENLDLEQNFREVLENIEVVFSEQYEKLISSEAFDLDVDIEVLNTLLKKQGIN
ncbi:MAG: 5-bromo-4-chloroindolyl phosphate hydrolysis family protein [Marinicellaceae bacterium]